MESTARSCSRPMGNSISGLCDMSGNVVEWTGTRNGSTGAHIRGGNWMQSTPSVFRGVSLGAVGNVEATGSTMGFRCAADSAP